jgi:sugar phosphate isomerase/epimerase
LVLPVHHGPQLNRHPLTNRGLGLASSYTQKLNLSYSLFMRSYPLNIWSAKCSRRRFVIKTALSVAGAAVSLPVISRSAPGSSPIAVFSKVYQELSLGFEDAAALTAEAGLNGVDCPVRDGGEITPEKAADQLPRYSQVLGRQNLRIWLLTTGILSTGSPYAESVLRAASSLGIKYYRFGFIKKEPGQSEKLMGEVRAHLKDLAALNRELGLCVLLQNHSPSGGTTYFGGDLGELQEAVDGFDPNQVGVAFDIGHALVVHGDDWKPHFNSLKPHFKIAYVKDVKKSGAWVPFGQGDIAKTGYFQLLKQMGYREPVSLHIEFDWTQQGKAKNRASLVKALQESRSTLREWLS